MAKNWRLPLFGVFALLAACLHDRVHAEQVILNIGSINNPDMIELQRLAPQFEKNNPDIKLRWVTMDEGALRQRVTTDLAMGSGQFDVVTVGAYDAVIAGKQKWLLPFDNLPQSYQSTDLIPAIRDALTVDGEMTALPFYGESSMTYYRTDLMKAKGLTMPAEPTWDQITDIAAKLNDRKNGVYGICLRGRAGWGDNMAVIGTIVNAYGGRWFDMHWQPQIDTPQWTAAIQKYVDLLQKYGPPGATSNSFNENLVLFASGKCGIWVDATVAAGMLYDGKDSQVHGKIGFAAAPHQVTSNGSHWLWIWALAVPRDTQHKAEARRFVEWATSRDYQELVAKDSGWGAVPPGTRTSLYQQKAYLDEAPFASFVLNAIETADTRHPGLEPVSYTGIQLVMIPEFQALGTLTGQAIAGALSGRGSVGAALKLSQSQADRLMRQGRYIK